MVTNIFQNSYATLLIRLLIRINSDVKVTYNYLSDLYEILYSDQLKDGKYKDGIYFQIYYATPIIRLLIRVISDIKVTCNYLSDLNEIWYRDQFEDGNYCCDSYFSKFLCHTHTYNQAINQGT